MGRDRISVSSKRFEDVFTEGFEVGDLGGVGCADALQDIMRTITKTITKTGEDAQNEPFSNCLGDLKKNIEYLIGMERQSGSMEVCSPLYVSRMLNVPLDEVEKCMREMK